MALPDEFVLNADNVAYNNNQLYSAKMASAIVAGCAAGILGLTSLGGFAFFAAVSLLTSAALVARAGSGWRPYFSSRGPLVSAGLFQALLSFILFWALFFNIVHIY
eukprot:m51a1_g314 hypothetical protein (106) ;mRNA; f:416723-417418